MATDGLDMRARMIKPGFFANEDVGTCSAAARLLFIGLWTLADREGRLEDRPRKIWAQLFPYDHDLDMDQLLNELASKGLVTRYQAGGMRCILIPKFKDHQKPHPNESESDLPGFGEDVNPQTQKESEVAEYSDSDTNTSHHGAKHLAPKTPCIKSCIKSLTPLPPVGGSDLFPDTATASRPPKARKPRSEEPLPGFDAFWQAYPRKDAKIRAVRAWNSLHPDPLLQRTILEALTRQRHSAQWLRDGGQYIPLPATYLNSRRWEDQGAQPVAAEPVDAAAEMLARRAEAQRLAAECVPPPKKPREPGT